MNPSEPNLKKQLLVDDELTNIFKKYDLPTNMTPYGILGKLIDRNATYEDMFDLHCNQYFSTSLLYNGNRWQ